MPPVSPPPARGLAAPATPAAAPLCALPLGCGLALLLAVTGCGALYLPRTPAGIVCYSAVGYRFSVVVNRRSIRY